MRPSSEGSTRWEGRGGEGRGGEGEWRGGEEVRGVEEENYVGKRREWRKELNCLSEWRKMLLI